MQDSNKSIAKVGFSAASERNKNSILGVLTQVFRDCRTILEIGSGTGQHAVYFAQQLPTLTWQPTDTVEFLDGLRKRISGEAPKNVEPPIELDVRMQPWPVGQYDAVFSANTLHYMSWPCVEKFFSGVGATLTGHSLLCIYGPFRYRGAFTSDSNAVFDQQLKRLDGEKGIRDFEAINELANVERLKLMQDVPMPANNQMLVWGR
jgi:cyclopropane fatty-acyl-phospholipid synthase-like methyltransferase